MTIVFELVRIIAIFLVLGWLGSAALTGVYTIGGETVTQPWMGFLGILLLLFVLYRNKWQFSGWYKGEGREKLSKSLTKIMTMIALLLIIVPFIYHP